MGGFNTLEKKVFTRKYAITTTKSKIASTASATGHMGPRRGR